MTREITPESLIRIYEKLGVQPAPGDRVAVKISTGEPGGHNFLKPELIAGQFAVWYDGDEMIGSRIILR